MTLALPFTGYRTLASGTLAYFEAGTLVSTDADYDGQEDEGPTCSICDALGHGYPGGGPCPLEERGSIDPDEDARDRYFDSLIGR
jgi:hypothetical protein